jgi:hypothetical protein
VLGSLWRRLTDKLVYCAACGQPVGFMARFTPGARVMWAHDVCPSPGAHVED